MAEGNILIQIVVGVTAFFLMVAIGGAAIVWWRAKRRQRVDHMEQRLGLVEAQQPSRILRLWKDGQEATILVAGMPARPTFSEKLGGMLRDAGWTIEAKTLMWYGLAASVIVFVIVLVIAGHPLAGVCAVAAMLSLFWAFLKRAISKRSALFDQQLVEALDLACRSLRAGHPLIGSFQLVAQEIDEPMGAVFAEIVEQQSLGVDMEQALRGAAEKCAREDMRLFATCVAMQTHSGGNLADMMERLALVIRDRIRLSRRVRVLTAQTQFSKRVLAALPLLLFVLLNVVNPKYIGPLYNEPTGQIMLSVAALSVMMGMWMMNRMTQLEY
ncbi:MAG: type II secretion system F family protein [Planctomycetota bacterium]|jgi:tight adherence protein B